MAAFDGGPEIEQAFIASWDAVERFYILTYSWGHSGVVRIDPNSPI
jgi:hypothetical protein